MTHILKPLLIVMFLTTASCSGPAGAVLGALGGGGPNVAANVQAGRTNTQTVGVTQNTDQRIVRPQARTITQDNSSTQQIPDWVWVLGAILFIVGWTTDTPGTMLKNLWRKK